MEMCTSTGSANTSAGDGPSPPAVAMSRSQNGGGKRPPRPWQLWCRAKWRDRCGDAAESLERRCGGGWSHAVKVCRLLLCVRTPQKKLIF